MSDINKNVNVKTSEIFLLNKNNENIGKNGHSKAYSKLETFYSINN